MAGLIAALLAISALAKLEKNQTSSAVRTEGLEGYNVGIGLVLIVRCLAKLHQ